MGKATEPKPYHSYRQAHRNGFWAKVKIRRVFPFLGIFLAFGFLVLEGVQQLIDHGAIPDSFYWLALILYLFGIPGTIFLAWYHGEKGPQKLQTVEYWLHGGLLVGAAMAAFLFVPESSPASEGHPVGSVEIAPTSRFSIELPPDFPLSIPPTRGFPLALSPDGRRLVYVSRCEVGTELVTHRLDDFESEPVPDTHGARQPFFSPNGRYIGFFADGELLRVPSGGGVVTTIAEVSGVTRGASWGADGIILVSVEGSGLHTVPASGGDLTPVSFRMESGVPGAGDGNPSDFLLDRTLAWPDHLPGGEHALVSYDDGIGILSLKTGELHYLRDGWQARYLDTGHILFTGPGGDVFRAPFDSDRLALSRPPTPVLDGVFRAPAGGGDLVAASQSGVLVFVPGSTDRTLTLVDRNGLSAPLTEERRGYRWPRFEPEGDRIAVTVDPMPSDLWLLEDGDAFRKTTRGHDVMPVWSPHGRHLAFNREGSLFLWEVDAGAEPKSVEGAPKNLYPVSWSPDGKVLALNETNSETGLDIVFYHVDEDLPEAERYQPFLVTSADESLPHFSPDGGMVAYTSDINGLDQVYVNAYPGPDRPRLISSDGGRDPLWSRDGKELYFRKGDSVMAVTVDGEAPTFGDPVLLFVGEFDHTQMRNWDVSHDGRFVMVEDDPATTRRFRVIVNWTSELDGRIAGDAGR